MHHDKWQDVTIGELGDVFTGRTPPTAQPVYFGNEFPFITPGDMRQGKYVRVTQRNLSQEGAKLLTRIKLPANSICVSCIGWQMGEVIMTTDVSFTNQQINSIVPSPRVDASFLYYTLQPRKQELLSLGAATGVRTPILNKSSFCKLKIKLPSLSMQQRIASILSAYDELIENNQRRVQILEEMARALYREWFVHFKIPVGVWAKMDASYKIKLVASPIGNIPQDWEILPIGELAKIVLGGTPSRGVHEYWDGGTIPWLKSGKLNDIRVIEGTELITKRGLEMSAAKLMPPKTVLVAITGAILISFLEIEACANQSVIGIYNLKKVCAEYLHIYLRENISIFESKMSGSAQQHINKEIVEQTLVPIPPQQIAEAFRRFVEPIYEEISLLLFKNQTLLKTRALLLPRLISGQINLEGG